MTGSAGKVPERVADVVAAALVLATHLPTMYPGLMGSGDTAKFQYLGHVLGTPHNPGYPFYILLSFLFSWVPIGTLAYRANLLSVVGAVVTVILMRRLFRRLHASHLCALACAVAFGWGLTFWEFALRAEVYTVAGALLAGTLLFLARWRDSRRDADLLGAVAFVAAGLGHHLTIVTCVPAFVAFVLATDARAALRPRVVLLAVLLVAAGLLQYSFIIVRTLQHAPYLESRATSLAELAAVVTGRQFAGMLLPSGTDGAVASRLPALLAALGRELGVLASLALVPGLITVAARRWRELILWLGAAAGALAFAAVYRVPDFAGFLVPVVMCLWPVSVAGIEAVTTRVRHWLPGGAVVATLLALAVPTSALLGNYRYNDHSRRTYELDYFDALFAMLPDRSVLLPEAYAVNQMVLYKLLGERAAGPRDVRLLPHRDPLQIRELARQGYAVFAFQMAARELTERGFEFAPVVLTTRGAGGAQPIDMQHLPLFRLTSADRCVDLGNAGWVDVTSLARLGQGMLRIRVDNYRPFDSQVSLLVTGSASPPRVLPFLGAAVFEARAHVLGTGADEAPLPITDGERSTAWRADAMVNDRGDSAQLAADVGGAPARVFARAVVDLDNPRRATLCAESVDKTHVDASSPLGATIALGPRGDALLGDGWHAPETRAGGSEFRWTSATDARVLFLRREAGALRISFEARGLPASNGRPRSVELLVNGTSAGVRPLGLHWQRILWEVDRPWYAGLNEVVLRTSAPVRPRDLGLGADDRLLGVAVGTILLEPLRAQ
jgi:hypothetical protein